jgi:hypothetical protein
VLSIESHYDGEQSSSVGMNIGSDPHLNIKGNIVANLGSSHASDI